MGYIKAFFQAYRLAFQKASARQVIGFIALLASYAVVGFLLHLGLIPLDPIPWAAFTLFCLIGSAWVIGIDFEHAAKDRDGQDVVTLGLLILIFVLGTLGVIFAAPTA